MSGAAQGTDSIEASELAALLEDLIPIGRDGSGATTRLAWSQEDERARVWFTRRADAIGLGVERDPAGNLWAAPGQQAPWWAVGSHLDTVLAGGSFDGALGVAAGFAIAARVPVAVIAFADEEGARFNTPTFGSRALAGRLHAADVLSRTDDRGQTLKAALRAAGVDPDGLSGAAAWRTRLRGLLELHIDQTRDLARAGTPAAVVSGLAARMRVQALVRGRADHAGTTPRAERSDALIAAARLIVAADELSGDGEEMVFTAGRIEVEPNAPSTVPAIARLWLDARAPAADRVRRWHERVQETAAAIARAHRVDLELTTASWSPPAALSEHVRAALRDATARAAGLHSLEEVLCWAGHDAGILAGELETGMVLVRNSSGISHAPAEQVSLQDAAVGANSILLALEALL